LAGKSLNLGAAGQCLRDPRCPRWLIANNLKCTLPIVLIFVAGRNQILDK